MKINVTKQNILDAKHCDLTGSEGIGQNCAIAKAVLSIFPNVTVGSEQIYFWEERFQLESRMNELKASSILPSEAKRFINNFDHSSVRQREVMSPISFEIDIPDIIIDEISIDELTEALKGYPSMELV